VNRLAGVLGIGTARLNEIVRGKRGITSGEIARDASGTPLFTAIGFHAGEARLSRGGIRVQTDKYLQTADLKRPGISNRAVRHYATLGYLHTGDLRAVQEFLDRSDPRNDLALRVCGGNGEAESGAIHH